MRERKREKERKKREGRGEKCKGNSEAEEGLRMSWGKKQKRQCVQLKSSFLKMAEYLRPTAAACGSSRLFKLQMLAVRRLKL